MIDMEVAEPNKIEIGKTRARLGEAQKRAASGINQYACSAVNPYDIARSCAVVVGNWPARTQHLQRDTLSRRAGDWCSNR